jgi:hypothetical protein
VRSSAGSGFYLILELLVILARVVVAAGGVDEDLTIGLAVAVAVREQLKERFSFDLRDRIPDRHVNRPDGHRALALVSEDIPSGRLAVAGELH